MNTYSQEFTAPSDETVSATTTLPELSDLNSSTSTFHSNSSISSIDSDTTDEVASSSPDFLSQQEQEQTNNNRGTTRTRPSLDTRASTSTSRRFIQGRRNYRLNQSTATRRINTSVLVLNNLLQFSFSTIMNAAITIFGVGIGVGLILADSFRSPGTTNNNNNSSNSNINASSLSNHHHVLEEQQNHATITVSAATPTCRATIRRAMDRIQEAPPISLASISALPAQ
ncbi:unnamed protein product [Cylindrotheca closterium]|uniref:Uncharacterized protein n=1 Tax=Cylindrotheca closterium TaxID=2856 RepID=A0AAD2GB42_9STRA|nr:unnamed protein product [Cylindrotheca closterium]